MSIVCGVIIFWLFVSELSFYLSTEVRPQLFVDTSRGEKLKINLDITFHSIPCACMSPNIFYLQYSSLLSFQKPCTAIVLSLDTMDVSGEHQTDIAHNIFKKRLRDGKPVSVERQQSKKKDPARLIFFRYIRS